MKSYEDSWNVVYYQQVLFILGIEVMINTEQIHRNKMMYILSGNNNLTLEKKKKIWLVQMYKFYSLLLWE